MYVIIIYLFLFEFLFSKIGNGIINLIRIDNLINKFNREKNNVYGSCTDAEIERLEKEVWELNKPSTFTEYVKKSRQLNKLKKQLQSKNCEYKNNIENKGSVNGKISNMLFCLINFANVFINCVVVMPMYVKQILVFMVLTTFVDESKYSVYIDPRLYSPFYKGCPGRSKAIFLNKVMSYGIALTIYDFGKYLIKLTYLNIKLNIVDVNNNGNIDIKNK
ncbi:hypothetical protein FG386_000061 [Cryptosporidium ryanae]|uniref:uncharacterized protein n=1 Tax=Cryptosporidium ryanae TaxID=515981 RepID=UPI003519FB22|nr:hypothetical protein FG386_000061 [Cryptosporidium ryanae]